MYIYKYVYIYTSSARHSFKKRDMSIGIGLLIGIVCELERDEMKLATKERRDEMKWRKQRPYFGHHGSHFTRKNAGFRAERSRECFHP